MLTLVVEDVYKVLGKSIRAARRDINLTLDDLGELTDMHGAFIGQIERNQKKASLTTVCRIADALDLRPSDLLAEMPKASKPDNEKRLLAALKGSTPSEYELILSLVRPLSRALRGLRK